MLYVTVYTYGIMVDTAKLPSVAIVPIYIYILVGKIPFRRAWEPSPVFLSDPKGQRSLEGYSPWGRKQSDTTV